ncbi:uncharacterized protein VTP21DRAFT_6170 [Calcarisporiella thermophila]|uniref:uncharacterized protein n=1 Tax=Calcarisporiella thermophila TaxID=911321 RepID=UPI003742948C
MRLKLISFALVSLGILCSEAYNPAGIENYDLRGISIETPTSKVRLRYGRYTNIHIKYYKHYDDSITFEFAPCDSTNRTVHSILGTVEIPSEEPPTKFSWLVPEHPVSDSAQCIQIWNEENELITQSEPLTLSQPIVKRSGEGRHFIVAQHLEKRDHFKAAEDHKKKRVGIVGAGMAGLYAGFLLESVGLPYEILEASDRIGGRVWTHYFDNDKTQFAELGPMRIPYLMKKGEKKIVVPEHQLVYMLSDKLNQLHHNKTQFRIEFFPFLTPNANNFHYFYGARRSDGLPPTNADFGKDPSLVDAPKVLLREGPVNAIFGKLFAPLWKELEDDFIAGREKLIKMGVNDYSVTSYLKQKMGLPWDVIDYFEAMNRPTAYNQPDMLDTTLETFTFGVSDWRAIKYGSERLPKAILPFVRKNLRTGMKISKISLPNGKVQLSYKKKAGGKYYDKTYDYAIITAPFSLVRTWKLPRFSWWKYRAIYSLAYQNACKVFAQFDKRFWEQDKRNPIHGGCSRTDLLPKMVCYPSFDLDGDGRGVLLASYSVSEDAARILSLPDDDLIEGVLDGIAAMHGDIVYKSFTGNWIRHCFGANPLSSGAFALYNPGQHQLFLKSIMEMENNIAFAGEHTDYKHGWISSALNSAARSVVQVLVEMGHVDEAKKLKKDWDLFWVDI